MSSGVPKRGSGMIEHGTPKTRSTRSSVSTAASESTVP